MVVQRIEDARRQMLGIVHLALPGATGAISEMFIAFFPLENPVNSGWRLGGTNSLQARGESNYERIAGG